MTLSLIRASPQIDNPIYNPQKDSYKPSFTSQLEEYKSNFVDRDYNTLNFQKANFLHNMDSYLSNLAEILQGNYTQNGKRQWRWDQRLKCFNKKMQEFDSLIQESYKNSPLTKQEILEKTSHIQNLLNIATKENKYFKNNFKNSSVLNPLKQTAYNSYNNLTKEITNSYKILTSKIESEVYREESERINNIRKNLMYPFNQLSNPKPKSKIKLGLEKIFSSINNSIYRSIKNTKNLIRTTENYLMDLPEDIYFNLTKRPLFYNKFR
ncbi:MAG: hypothetical protein WC438_05365 [Candidatus Pacearchaeota archaeon]